MVARALVREELGRNLANRLVVEERAQLAGVGDLADRRVVQLPAVEHRLDPLEQLGPADRDHPLLALGDHDLPSLHLLLAQRDAVEADVDAGSAAGHLGQSGREPGRPAVLQRLDEPRLDELERGLDQLLAGERIADLDGRALLLRALAELLAREHRGAADPVASGRGAEEDECVPGPLRAGASDPLGRQEPHAHRVHEAVPTVGLVEDRLAADVRHPDAVPVVPDPRDGPTEAQAVAAEAQAVEQRDRPRAHRDDVSQDPADAGRRALKRLDGRGMVVRLDLERDRLAVAEVDHARVLTRPLQDARAGRGQPLQEQRRVLVAAVLRPEQREDRELEVIRLAREQLADSVELAVGETERLVERLFEDPRQGIDTSRGSGQS